MTKKEQIFAVLERNGYKPKYDDDGDLFVIYQMKHIYFPTNDEDEDPFVSILFPQFADFAEGQETLYLAACNKMTRDTKFVKVYIDHTFENITASCEFYYANEESLEDGIKRAFHILGVIRTLFRNCIKELSAE